MTAAQGSADETPPRWVCDKHGEPYGAEGCPSCRRNWDAFAGLVDAAHSAARDEPDWPFVQDETTNWYAQSRPLPPTPAETREETDERLR